MGRLLVWAPLAAVVVACLLNAVVQASSAARATNVIGAYESKGNDLQPQGSAAARTLLQSNADKMMWRASVHGNEDRLLEAIDRGADVNGRFTTHDGTPLLAAVANGHMRVVRSLIAAGADVNAVDADGFSPFSMAVLNADLDMVMALVDSGATPRGLEPRPLAGGDDGVDSTIFTYSADYDEYTEEEGGDDAWTAGGGVTGAAAGVAASGGPASVKKAVDFFSTMSGANMVVMLDGNVAGESLPVAGALPLTSGIGEVSENDVGESTEAEWVSVGPWNEDEGEEEGFPTVAWDANKMLLRAVRQGSMKKMRVALRRGADVDAATGRHGTTPLLMAVRIGDVRAAKLLIDEGADVEAADGDGVTPLVTAVFTRNPTMVAMLLAAGADPNGQFPEAPSSGRGQDDGYAFPPLFAAADVGDARILQALLDAGARVDLRDDMGETALFGVMFNVGPAGEAAARALLGAGADPNARGSDGRTPLFLAAQMGNLGVAKVLLEAGADASIEDSEGVTASSLICECEKEEKEENAWFPMCPPGGCSLEGTKERMATLLSVLTFVEGEVQGLAEDVVQSEAEFVPFSVDGLVGGVADEGPEGTVGSALDAEVGVEVEETEGEFLRNVEEGAVVGEGEEDGNESFLKAVGELASVVAPVASAVINTLAPVIVQNLTAAAGASTGGNAAVPENELQA